MRALQAKADAFRRQLRAQAAEVFAAQDKAHELLAVAEQLAAQQQAAEDLARLEAQRQALDDVSAAVTAVLTPAQTRRSRAAAQNQAPVLAVIEAAGSDYPRGYAPTGADDHRYGVLVRPGLRRQPHRERGGVRPGAAHLRQQGAAARHRDPRVANGRAVSCLVNDRGPYVGDRILDMSRAGSRALG